MMTPHDTPRTTSSGFITGLSIGLGICLVFLCAGSAGGYFYVKRAYDNARKGWRLEPVIVAAVDIPAGTEVTMELISQRSIPEQFMTESIVQPVNASAVVGQKTRVTMRAGDPLLWSHFGLEPRK